MASPPLCIIGTLSEIEIICSGGEGNIEIICIAVGVIAGVVGRLIHADVPHVSPGIPCVEHGNLILHTIISVGHPQRQRAPDTLRIIPARHDSLLTGVDHDRIDNYRIDNRTAEPGSPGITPRTLTWTGITQTGATETRTSKTATRTSRRKRATRPRSRRTILCCDRRCPGHYGQSNQYMP